MQTGIQLFLVLFACSASAAQSRLARVVPLPAEASEPMMSAPPLPAEKRPEFEKTQSATAESEGGGSGRMPPTGPRGKGQSRFACREAHHARTHA